MGIDDKKSLWYNEFNRFTIKFSDINSWRNLRYVLRTRYIFDAICACGTRIGIYIISQRSKAELYRIWIEWEYIARAWASISQKEESIRNDKIIKELAVELTVEITAICDNIKGRAVFVNQLLRSCSSIGANSHEAKYAQSRADFIHKLEIALKECYETEYWLEILYKVNALQENV